MGRHGRRRTPGVVRMGVALSVLGAALLPAGAATAADEPVRADLVSGTPCTAAAEACVDLDGQQAWLIEDGKVVRGPLPISTGGPGAETPTGTFQVEWKHVDHVSSEFGTPIPYSVFFATGGIAFHEGPLDHPSAGCIRLAKADAEAFFGALAVGDEVQVR